MKPHLEIAFCCPGAGRAPLFAGAPLQPAQAQAADPAVAQVQGFYDALPASMKSGGTAKSRYEKLKPAVEKAFDLPAMTATAVGPTWASASDADKKALMDAFSRMTIANYAKNFDSYGGEKFIVEPASIARGSDHFVKSTMKTSSEPSPSTIACIRWARTGRSPTCSWPAISARWRRSAPTSPRRWPPAARRAWPSGLMR